MPSQPDPDTSSASVTEELSGMVTWIVDGDTIEVETPEKTLEVRLLAINAPDREECFAERSLDHLIDTLKDRSVRLDLVDRDQFDRTLAHVFEGDRHINQEMVAMGLAIASTPHPDDPYGPAILDAESQAFSARAGLWSANACGSEEPLPEISIDISRSRFDPEGPDEDNLAQEQVTIFNGGSEAVDLTGWIIRDTSTRHRFMFAEARLGPGQSIEVRSTDPGWDPGNSPVWSNDGDMALLQMPDGTVVDRVRY